MDGDFWYAFYVATAFYKVELLQCLSSIRPFKGCANAFDIAAATRVAMPICYSVFRIPWQIITPFSTFSTFISTNELHTLYAQHLMRAAKNDSSLFNFHHYHTLIKISYWISLRYGLREYLYANNKNILHCRLSALTRLAAMNMSIIISPNKVAKLLSRQMNYFRYRYVNFTLRKSSVICRGHLHTLRCWYFITFTIIEF